MCYALTGVRGGRGGYRRSLVAAVDVYATFTAADGDRVWLPLPQCLVSTQYFVLYAIMLGYYKSFCHVCEYHEVGIVKWTLVRACGLRSGW